MPQIGSSFATTPGAFAPAVISTGARSQGALEPASSFSATFAGLPDCLRDGCHESARLSEACSVTAGYCAERSETESNDPLSLENEHPAGPTATDRRDDPPALPTTTQEADPAPAEEISTAPDARAAVAEPSTDGLPPEAGPDISGHDARAADDPNGKEAPPTGLSALGMAPSAPLQSAPDPAHPAETTGENPRVRASNPDGHATPQAETRPTGTALVSGDSQEAAPPNAVNRPDPTVAGTVSPGSADSRATADLTATAPPQPAGAAAAQVEPPRAIVATVPPTTASPQPTPVISDTHVTLANATGGRTEVEIALSPAELGSVRLFLSADSAQIGVSVMAERPETLELIRRHVDLLAAELGRLGYDSSNLHFSFGQGGSERAPSQPMSAPDTGEGQAPAGARLERGNRILSAARLDLRV